MSDTHTDETTEFNDYLITVGNYKRLDAHEFKKDIELQRLFNMFFFRIKDDVFNRKNFHKELINYFNERYKDTPEDALNKVFGTEAQRRHGHGLLKLFKIENLKTAMSIYCNDYQDISFSFDDGLRKRAAEYCRKQDTSKYNQCLQKILGKNIRPTKEIKENTLNTKKILKSVSDWHDYCIAINKAEAYLIKKHSGWGSEFSKADRRKVNKELKSHSEALLALDNNKFNSMAFYDISEVNKYRFKSLKIDNLLSHNLPNIDNAKAKLITENLISPYNEQYN